MSDVKHDRALQRAVYNGLVDASGVQSISKSQINCDCDEDGEDLFVLLTTKASRPPETQVGLLSGAIGASVAHCAGSQAMDSDGKFAQSPEGDSITVVLAGESFLRVDIDNPDDWHDISDSRLKTRTAMNMTRV